MDKIKKHLGKIVSVHIEDMVLKEPFIDFAARFSCLPGTVVLMSGGKLDCARYHILAANPWLTVTGKGGCVEVTADGFSESVETDAFDILRLILDRCKIDVGQKSLLPIRAGLFGYLSYDLKDNLERLPRTVIDDLYLPEVLFYAPSIIVIHDKKDNRTRLCIPQRDIFGKNRLNTDRESFYNTLSAKIKTPSGFSGDMDSLKSNFTKPAYMETIKKIREYISSGDAYQVNMSQRFEAGFAGDPFCLFKELYEANPAPFFAYINAGSHQIVSTSPERFIKQTGTDVETRPIKGTRPRGKNPKQDKRLREELEQSRKDDAELSMIVDLLRNDLGKVCKGGTVRVAEHKRLEAYENVYHLVSVVKGSLDKNRDTVDLIKATFPGGSITGCPKIRSMEIIDELEPHRRHLYTGSIGYISFHDTMDLSIAIRTATVYNNKIIFSVGGGIVFDSDPEDEFEETLHKGKTLMESIKGNKNRFQSKSTVWQNGKLIPVEKAGIPVSDRGLQYGYGFFETIRAEKGRLGYLKDHMDRFHSAWESLFPQPVPDITWEEVIRQVLSENDLMNKTAAVKILATGGSRQTPPFDNTLLVTAGPYTHRLEDIKKPGLDLALYPHPRQTPLADHKTLNYLYYFLAGKWAKENHGDEALIINPDHTVSETNTANIILIKNRSAIKPYSPHVLPGIMGKTVCGYLNKLGYEIRTESIMPNDFYSADQVILTNSLMGAVPILSLDGKKTAGPTGLCQEINRAVL